MLLNTVKHQVTHQFHFCFLEKVLRKSSVLPTQMVASRHVTRLSPHNFLQSPTLGLGLYAMTKSQHFTGPYCLKLSGESNLHHRKMNHLLSQNGFPHSCVTFLDLFPHFDRPLSSTSVYMKAHMGSKLFEILTV